MTLTGKSCACADHSSCLHALCNQLATSWKQRLEAIRGGFEMQVYI